MESLGIDLKILIAQTVNFVIVMILLWKFAYNPIIKILDERKNKIAQGLKDAESAAKSKEETIVESRAISDKAHAEASEILKNAKESAVSEANEIIKKANDQADRILENAKNEAASMKDKILREAKGEIAGVVSLALDKIVNEELDRSTKEKITAIALKEL